jgi:hypothetical protein
MFLYLFFALDTCLQVQADWSYNEVDVFPRVFHILGPQDDSGAFCGRHLPFHFDHLPTQPSPIFFYFSKFAGIKKQKIPAYHVFRKYRLKTIYSGTNFSSFLDFRLILSITAQCSVNLCGRTKCLGAMERYSNTEYYKLTIFPKAHFPELRFP